MTVSFFVDRIIFLVLKEQNDNISGIRYCHWNGWMRLQNEHTSIASPSSIAYSLNWVCVDDKAVAPAPFTLIHAHRMRQNGLFYWMATSNVPFNVQIALIAIYVFTLMCVCRYIEHFRRAHTSSNTKLITFTMQIYSWMPSTKTWTAFGIANAYWICAADSINYIPKRKEKTNVNFQHYPGSQGIFASSRFCCSVFNLNEFCQQVLNVEIHNVNAIALVLLKSHNWNATS